MIEQILHCQVYFIDNDTWINLVVIKFVKYLNRIYYSNIFFFCKSMEKKISALAI